MTLVVTVWEDGEVPPSITLGETHASVRRQHMGYIHQDVLSRCTLGEGIAVYARSIGGSQLYNDIVARLGFVVAHRSLIRYSSTNGLVGQRLRDVAHERELGDRAVFGRTSRALLVHHGESRELPRRQVARVRVGAVDIQIRAQLDHAKGPCDAGEVVASIFGAGEDVHERSVVF